MRVNVDKPGRDHLSACIDLAPSTIGDLRRDHDDAPLAYAEVAGFPRRTGAVVQQAAADDHIEVVAASPHRGEACERREPNGAGADHVAPGGRRRRLGVVVAPGGPGGRL